MALARSRRFGGHAGFALVGRHNLPRRSVRRSGVCAGSHSRPDTAAQLTRSRRSCPFKRVGGILLLTNLCLPPIATPVPLTFGNFFGPVVLTRSGWKRAPI